MLKNYIVTAFRSLWRNKAHSLINILGLSLGIASCILIALFVNDEWMYDRFHSKSDRIYRVFARENWGENQEFFYTTTPFPMGSTLKGSIPEVEEYVRIVKAGTQVKVGNDQYSETLTIADAAIFRVFDFEIINGSRETALSEAGDIVLSKWVALKYFGDEDAVGKPVSLQLGEEFAEFTVSAVVDVPTNSSIQFYLLISEQNLPRLYDPRVLTSGWFNINPETYVLLREGADRKTVTEKFPSLFRTVLGEEQYARSHYEPGLQPLLSIHLDTGYPAGLAPVSNPAYSYTLAGIAILILVVGCINFVTLSVGKSLRRAKEVGIRKVVGAVRSQLIVQFIGEAVLITLIAMLVGIALAVYHLPLFNDLSGKSLTISVDGFVITLTGALLVIIGLFAGSYPAFVLSSFRPISMLSAGAAGSSRQNLRKLLVGVQLVLSIFLISSTLIMRNQLSFLRNKDLGFNKEQLAVVPLNVPRGGRLTDRVNRGFEKARQLKAELSRVPEIASACAASHDFANGAWINVGFTDDNGAYRTFNVNVIDDDYLPTLQIELAAGRNFTDENPSDARRSVLINESFARLFGWENPLGQRIPGKNFADHEIVGVVKDFHYASLYTKVEPLAMVRDPAVIMSGIENINVDNSPVPKLLVRLRAGKTAMAVKKIERVWNRITAGEEFAFAFVDEALAAQYRADQNLGKIIGIATALAILIGALGLYGLVSLTMQSRVREISIRKVLGATESSLLLLLSKEYVIMILASLVVSVPATWYFAGNWLRSFEYKVPITPLEYCLAGAIALVVAATTIAHEAIKTAFSQPARTLKHE